MGKKYIIDLNPDCVEGEYLRIPARIAGEQQWLMTKAALTPYTETDLEHVRKEAYEAGAKSSAIVIADDKAHEAYQRGLADAWEAARMIICEMDYEDCMKIFGGDNRNHIFALSPTTVIEKLKAYEQEQEEIKVGDEVENTQTGVKFIVTHQWKNNRGEQGVSGFNYSCSAFSTALDLVRKTGRHFPEIAAVLEKM